MRNAVKTVGRLAKEKSRTAYKEVRSKFKDMQTSKESEETTYPYPTNNGNGMLREKPRSAPSSPKIGGGGISINQRRVGVLSPATLKQQLSSTLVDRSGNYLRRCETSVSQHYHVGETSPGQPIAEINLSSSSSSSDEDDLNMAPLNLNLMDDMKDILARSCDMGSSSTPPAIDRSVNTSPSFWLLCFVQVSVFLVHGRCFCFFFVFFSQRKPSLSSPPVSPLHLPIHRKLSSPLLLSNPIQILPLPPPRCRKRNDAPELIFKVIGFR